VAELASTRIQTRKAGSFNPTRRCQAAPTREQPSDSGLPLIGAIASKDDFCRMPIHGPALAMVQQKRTVPSVAGAGPAQVLAAAMTGTGGASEPLPLLDQVQKSFGRYDAWRVRAHLGSAATHGAAAIGAAAFATGDHVVFAEKLSLLLAAHEAAHVVQQRAERDLPGGVGQVGDRYEQHADAVAARVAAGQRAKICSLNL
jgi:hypothetical protein